MKPKNRYITGCTSSTSSDCITWNGPDISALGIEHGMSVTEVEHLLACKVLEISEGLDVSSIDLSCLIDQSNVSADNKNVKLVLQLLLDNQCSLKELIDSIDGSGSGDVSLNLNLRCLKKFDDFDNEIPQDLNQTLQSIVNQVCTNKDDITGIKADINNLQDQIDNLPDPPAPYTEPVISTCSATSKPLSQAVVLLGNDFCNYKTSIGTPSQIQGALAQQCENLNNSLGSEIGWNIAPQNLAQSFSNLWIAYCNLLNRVAAIEQTCCAPSCDKIKIGFNPEFDEDGNVVLNFTSGAGTAIPSGFVDCGTTLNVIDKNGVSVQFFNLNITQGGFTEALNIGALAPGTLSFSFKTKFCLKDDAGAVIMTCQDCIAQDVEYSGSGCCGVTNTSSGDVTIVYTVDITNSTP